MDIELKIKNILSNLLKLKKEDIHNNSNILSDLNGDSVKIVEIIIDMETEFNIDISMDDTVSFLTVQNLIDYVNTKI